MAKVFVSDDCVMCGACVDASENLFQVGSEKSEFIPEEYDESMEERVQAAIEICPVSAISIEAADSAQPAETV